MLYEMSPSVEMSMSAKNGATSERRFPSSNVNGVKPVKGLKVK